MSYQTTLMWAFDSVSYHFCSRHVPFGSRAAYRDLPMAGPLCPQQGPAVRRGPYHHRSAKVVVCPRNQHPEQESITREWAVVCRRKWRTQEECAIRRLASAVCPSPPACAPAAIRRTRVGYRLGRDRGRSSRRWLHAATAVRLSTEWSLSKPQRKECLRRVSSPPPTINVVNCLSGRVLSAKTL
jgi:hypothetical protein